MTADRPAEDGAAPSSAPAPAPGRERDPGDVWVEAPTGERYWGRYGAAGLVAVDADRGVLLQHRAEWSHHGGTWGIPGGALHRGESSHAAALREAHEEAGVPARSVLARSIWREDREVWAYTTVVADVVEPFEPLAGDAESLELRWVPVEDVDTLPLHPAFARAWPALRRSIATRPHLVVDGANVVGAVPDGWWRDRQGAAERLVVRVADLARAGVPAASLGLGGERWYPPFDVVVEGAARAAAPADGVTVIPAPGSGDDAIVARVQELASAGASPIVITSDRELRSRVERAGGTAHGAGWILDLLEGHSSSRL